MNHTLRRGARGLRHPVLTAASLVPSAVAEVAHAPPLDRPPPRSYATDPALLAQLTRADDGLRRALTGVTKTARRATVDARTGLVWGGAALLNPPFVDDLAHAEALARRSLMERARHRPRDVDGPLYVLRHVWERNAYHFLFDLLGQLRSAEQLGLARVLVDSRLSRDPRFEHLIRANPAFGTLEVHVCDVPVRATGVSFGRNGWADPGSVGFVVDRVSQVVEARDDDRRLFVMRRPAAGRAIANQPAIAPVLQELGYEAVYPEELSAREQGEVFASASAVAGVHGAGLANIVFRARRPLRVLELLPRSLVHPFYFNLCCCLGARYEALLVDEVVREGGPRRHDVIVDPRALRAGLHALAGRG